MSNENYSWEDFERDAEEQINNDEDYGNMPQTKTGIFYLFPLSNVINTDKKELLVYSPNSIKICYLNPKNFIEFSGFKSADKKLGYATKQAMSNVDGEIAVYENFSETIKTKSPKISEIKMDQLYLFSEIKITTEDEIKIFGRLVQSIVDPGKLTDNLNMEKTINIVDLDTFTTKDGNKIVIKIGESLSGIKPTKITLKKPKTFLLDHVKMLGTDSEGNKTWARLKTSNAIWPIYLNPIEKTDDGEVNFLSYWSKSNIILNIDEIKPFIVAPGNDGDIHAIYNLVGKTDRDIPINIEIKSIDDISWVEKGMTDTGEWKAIGYAPVEYFWEDGKPEEYRIDRRIEPNGKYPNGKISLSPDKKETHIFENTITSIEKIKLHKTEILKYSTLVRLLEEILTASYNYNNNFKGAGYVDGDSSKGLNKMAIYKQQFESKNIVEYVDGLEKSWEKKNDNLLQSDEYKNYKKLKVMLSEYIYGSTSISQGGNDDSKFLLPYYLKLFTVPTWTGNVGSYDDGSGIWTFMLYKENLDNTYASKDANILTAYLESSYFNINATNKTLEPKLDVISQKPMINVLDDAYYWPSIPNQISELKIASLNPGDMKLSDNNVGKYLLFGDEQIKNFYGDNLKNIKLSRVDLYEQLKTNNDFEILIDSTIKDPQSLIVGGIWGSGKWTIEIDYEFQDNNETKNSKLILDNLELFKIDKQDIGLIRISL